MNECICVPQHLEVGGYDAGCPVHDVHGPASVLSSKRAVDHETTTDAAAASFERDRAGLSSYEEKYGENAPSARELAQDEGRW